MTDKEKIHQILSSLWKNNDSVGKMCYNQALQDVQTAIDLQEESVSEDLGEYLYELSKQFQEVSFAKLSRIGVRVAKWQKEHLRTVGNRTMSRAEKFISEHTRNCSNVFVNPQLGGTEENHPWLTPDQARRAVEIAREEVIEWIDNHWREYVNVDVDGVVCFGHWKNDLRKAMKDE